MYPETMTNDPDRVAPDHRIQLPGPTPVRPRRPIAAGVLSVLLALSCFAASPAWAYKAGGGNDRPSNLKKYDNVAAYLAEPIVNRNKYTHVQIGSLVYLVTALEERNTAEAPLTDINLPDPVDDDTFGSVAVGLNARAGRPGNVAIGQNAGAGADPARCCGGPGSVAVGQNARAGRIGAIAIGQGSHALPRGSIALGHVSRARGRHSTAIGHRSHAQSTFSTALGHLSHAQGEHSIALGDQSHAVMKNSIAIGSGLISGSTIRPGARASGTNSIALGSASLSGPGAQASGTNSIAIGPGHEG